MRAHPLSRHTVNLHSLYHHIGGRCNIAEATISANADWRCKSPLVQVVTACKHVPFTWTYFIIEALVYFSCRASPSQTSVYCPISSKAASSVQPGDWTSSCTNWRYDYVSCAMVERMCKWVWIIKPNSCCVQLSFIKSHSCLLIDLWHFVFCGIFARQIHWNVGPVAWPIIERWIYILMSSSPFVPSKYSFKAKLYLRNWL